MTTTILAPRVISTGRNDLDKKMGAEIPLRSLTLIEGQSGSGKSTLAQHLLWGAATSGEKAIVYTTENTIRSLLSQMESLGMDLINHFLLDLVRIFQIQPRHESVDVDAAFQILLSHINSYDEYNVIILDSLSTFLTAAREDQILDFFSQCKSLCDGGKTIICTAHSHAFDERVLTRVRSLCDAHLRFLVESSGSELAKSMEVAKVRGADLPTGSIVRFAVEPGIGMRIIPESKARA